MSEANGTMVADSGYLDATISQLCHEGGRATVEYVDVSGKPRSDVVDVLGYRKSERWGQVMDCQVIRDSDGPRYISIPLSNIVAVAEVQP